MSHFSQTGKLYKNLGKECVRPLPPKTKMGALQAVTIKAKVRKINQSTFKLNKLVRLVETARMKRASRITHQRIAVQRLTMKWKI